MANQNLNTTGAGLTSTAATAGQTTPITVSQADIEARAQALAYQILQQQAAQSQIAVSGRVMTRFDLGSDVVYGVKTSVTTGLFSNGASSLTVMYTSSLQPTASKQYYYEVWNGTATTSEAQYSVAYGNRLGSGSSASGTLNDSPSKAVYSQYRLLLLDAGTNTFTLGDSTTTDSIYVVNFNRARIKDTLDPGNWQLVLGSLSGSYVANTANTGSNVKYLGTNIVKLIDDSGQSTQTNLTVGGRVFNIVSGSITNGVYNSTSPVYYGLAYPDMGILVLDANKLDLSSSLGFNTVTGSNIAGDNAWKLFTSISGSTSADSTNYAFQARNEESINSSHYFVRLKNGEYNFSNNPTFTTGSLGAFSQPTFIGDPKVYITTIGLYNDRNELLAVAKLSQPIQKSFNSETLIKVKLDF